MPTPRSLRLTLAPISTCATTSTPFQPSMLHQQTNPSSPPTPRLKSPAFYLSQTTTTVSLSNRHRQSSTPLSPSTTRILPVRPLSPLAWTWRCHLCHTTYRIGTTRRCLVDGHYFCSQPPPLIPVSPLSHEKLVPPPRLMERNEYHEGLDGKTAMKEVGKGKVNNGRKKKNSRKPVFTCTMAFDYLAWADWNAWRREVNSSSTTPIPTALSRIPGLRITKSRGEIVKTQKDCSTDCDFPSECRWRCSGAYLDAVREELEEEDGGRI